MDTAHSTEMRSVSITRPLLFCKFLAPFYALWEIVHSVYSLSSIARHTEELVPKISTQSMSSCIQCIQPVKTPQPLHVLDRRVTTVIGEAPAVSRSFPIRSMQRHGSRPPPRAACHFREEINRMQVQIPCRDVVELNSDYMVLPYRVRQH